MLGQIFQTALIVTTGGLLCWLVWLYGAALRDARYLDGWLLTAGMAAQVYFHARRKFAPLSPKAAKTWRRIHVFLGYVLVFLFVSHSTYSLPDSGLDWAIWSGFVLITLSGIFGIYLAWAVPAKLGPNDSTVFDRIPGRITELGRQIHALVTTSDQGQQFVIPLPAAPYEEWILDLYKSRLRGFFKEPQNLAAHMIGSQRHLKHLTGAIDALEPYVGKYGVDKLRAMKALVLEKDRLDFAYVHLGLTKLWLFVHVPLTYALVVLILLHILVVYAFASGVW